MFDIGTIVTYGTNGVYVIENIIIENFLGEAKKYYVLCEPGRKGHDKVFVPCDNERLVSQMKKILSKEELYALVDAVPDDSEAWIDDNRARSEHFKEVLSRADRLELLHMAKTIYFRKQEMALQGKRIFLSDENFLARAEKVLFDEFALVLDIKREDVIPFIIEQTKK